MSTANATWLNASSGAPSYTAQMLRQAESALWTPSGTPLGARSGVTPGGALAVTVASSTITVAPGTAVIQGVSSAAQGAYRVTVPTSTTLTLTAADATNTRIDLVYLRVRDTDADGSGFRDADAIYLAGTPSATPVAPSIPAGVTAIALATITVPKVGGGSPSVSTSTRPYAVAAGGITPGALPGSGVYVGQYFDDGTSLRRWNGSTFDIYSPASSTPWIAMTLNSGFTTNGNGEGTAAYRSITRAGTPFLELRGGISITTDPGTGSSTFITLPSSYRPLLRQTVAVSKSMSSGIGTTKVDINTDGTCNVFGTQGAGSSTSWISLNGLSVPLDNV